jgi:predicted dinucleotide-binding enzyme
MKIGILGTGDVGRALGTGFVSRGHEVMMGGRDAASAKAKAWAASAGPRARTGSFAEAAAFGEAVVIATLWSGTENALTLAKPDAMAGKLVMDATNPLVFAPNAPPALALGHTDSGGEQVQRWLPKARVVKVFNIVGHTEMVDPAFEHGPPDMFYCGNDEAAKKQVAEFLTAFGWRSTDIGGIEGARVLEPLCILWVLYGFKTGAWRHALAMLRK